MRRLYSLSFLPLWLLFWALTIILYAIAWRSGFERDFHGWFEMFYNYAFADCMNRKGMQITSLYQLTQFQLWVWSKLFGTHLLPWFLLQTGLYAAAGALLTDFFRKFYSDFGWKNALPIAFWGSVFALVAPHNGEIVVWKASYHYPVSVLLFAGIWLLLRRALLHGDRQALLWAVLLYAASIFTLELFYATLPLAVLITVFYVRARKMPPATYRPVVVALTIIAGLFLLHFWFYNLIYHKFIPHRQANLEAFFRETPLKTTGRFLHSEFHLLLQGRYWPQELRDRLNPTFYTKTGGMLSIIILFLAGLLSLFAAVRSRSQVPVFWLIAAAVTGIAFLLPTEVPFWRLYYNDRFLYFTALFQWQLVTVLFFWLFRRAALWVSLLLAVLLSGITLYTALQLRRSAKIFWRVMEDFRWKDAGEKPMLLLNVPANYKGIVFYQETPEQSELVSHMRIFNADTLHFPLQTVAGYNMEDTTDGVRVLVESDTVFYVTLIRPGLWYWSGTLGASDHGTERYQMKLDQWSHQYRMVLKDTGARLLFFNRGRWHEVDKSNRGVEQE